MLVTSEPMKNTWLGAAGMNWYAGPVLIRGEAVVELTVIAEQQDVGSPVAAHVGAAEGVSERQLGQLVVAVEP